MVNNNHTRFFSDSIKGNPHCHQHYSSMRLQFKNFIFSTMSTYLLYSSPFTKMTPTHLLQSLPKSQKTTCYVIKPFLILNPQKSSCQFYHTLSQQASSQFLNQHVTQFKQASLLHFQMTTNLYSHMPKLFPKLPCNKTVLLFESAPDRQCPISTS